MPVDVIWSCPSLDIEGRSTELPSWAAHREAWYEVASKVIEDAFEADRDLCQYDVFETGTGTVDVTIHEPAAVAGIYAVEIKTTARVVSVKAESAGAEVRP